MVARMAPRDEVGPGASRSASEPIGPPGPGPLAFPKRRDDSDASGPTDRFVVIGASAGGVEALQRVVRGLPSSFPAPLAVVLHMPTTSISRLPDILSRAGSLPAFHAEDGARLEPGVIYVAPPDRHIICSDHRLTLVEGPRENGVRPAVDPLFRSAARTYRDRLIAVVLSGTLDDGAAGIAAVHANGGITIAQDPLDAICPGMPLAAIESTPVDHVAPADVISDLLVELLGAGPVIRPALVAGRRPEPRTPGSITSDFVCPECGGVLRMFDDSGVFRFHCRVGHNYSPESLYAAQDARLEAALWAAIRSLEESASLARRLADGARQRRAEATARRFDAREQEAAERADLIRSAILTLSDLEETPPIGEAEPVASEDDAVNAYPGTHMGGLEEVGSAGD
jgi:two-component system, chemotaxis family, protein-glutamate methylesterase/glutaminase